MDVPSFRHKRPTFLLLAFRKDGRTHLGKPLSSSHSAGPGRQESAPPTSPQASIPGPRARALPWGGESVSLVVPEPPHLKRVPPLYPQSTQENSSLFAPYWHWGGPLASMSGCVVFSFFGEGKMGSLQHGPVVVQPKSSWCWFPSNSLKGNLKGLNLSRLVSKPCKRTSEPQFSGSLNWDQGFCPSNKLGQTVGCARCDTVMILNRALFHPAELPCRLNG